MAYELLILLKKCIIGWMCYICSMYYVLDLEVQNCIFLSRSHSQSCLDIAVKKVFCNTTTTSSGRMQLYSAPLLQFCIVEQHLHFS